MKKYLMENIEDYQLMSQKGVKQYIFPLDSIHNAIWDTAISPDNELYFALATELSTAGYVRLCRYDYQSNTVEELLKAEDVIMPSDRTIRASKFHTSISFMNDGRMAMTTHTTDKSPAHPSWMPIAYFHHIWEGFPGGNIVLYDPKTKKGENLGIPVPRETIYGSLYDAKHNALFFTGGFKGHTYRYDFDSHELIDFGQMSENWSFRLIYDKYGKIYSSSRSGYMYRIDPETLKVEDLNYRQPFETYPQYHPDYKALSHGGIGPDGRLYMCFFYSRKFVAFDSDTETFEVIGDYLPTECHVKGETRHGVFGMDFDSQGVLWYAVFSRNCHSGQKEKGFPSSLFRWDIARGGKPEWLGVIGTEKRGACWTSEVCIDKNDMMYIIGSNHLMDGPDITAVDLNEYRKNMKNFGRLICRDEYFVNPNKERYAKGSEFMYNMERIDEQNDTSVPNALAYPPIRLWRTLAPDRIEQSKVKALRWVDEHTMVGVCGQEQEYVFTVTDGKLLSMMSKQENQTGYDAVMQPSESSINEQPIDFTLPYYPGRQYKAKAVVQTDFHGKKVVGTEDGMLAVIDGEKVFSLGPAVYNGPIRCLCTAPDDTVVYGVGGDIDDIGMVFRYDDENGLRWLGHVSYDKPDPDSAINCPILSACAISPDNKVLAIGSGDRLGTLMFYQLDS